MVSKLKSRYRITKQKQLNKRVISRSRGLDSWQSCLVGFMAVM